MPGYCFQMVVGEIENFRKYSKGTLDSNGQHRNFESRVLRAIGVQLGDNEAVIKAAARRVLVQSRVLTPESRGLPLKLKGSERLTSRSGVCEKRTVTHPSQWLHTTLPLRILSQQTAPPIVEISTIPLRHLLPGVTHQSSCFPCSRPEPLSAAYHHSAN